MHGAVDQDVVFAKSTSISLHQMARTTSLMQPQHAHAAQRGIRPYGAHHTYGVYLLATVWVRNKSRGCTGRVYM
jgi:hypothetical protein